jgi:hypothetical protein
MNQKAVTLKPTLGQNEALLVPRGQWGVDKEMHKLEAEIEFCNRPVPPMERGTSLARTDLWFKVQGDLWAEEAIRTRFKEDQALENWRRSFVEARRDVTRQKFKARQQQNRAVQEAARTFCSASVLPSVAGQGHNMSPDANPCYWMENSDSASYSAAPYQSGGSGLEAMADSARAGWEGLAGPSFTSPVGERGHAAEVSVFEASLAHSSKNQEDSLLATGYPDARSGSKIAAEPHSSTSRRNQFNRVAHDGEHVPSTQFHSVESQPGTRWREYQALPNTGMTRSNIAPIPSATKISPEGHERKVMLNSRRVLDPTTLVPDKQRPFRAENLVKTGANHFDGNTFNAELNIPMTQSCYPEDFAGLALPLSRHR